MGHRSEEPRSFADPLRAADSGVSDGEQLVDAWPRPIRQRQWIDEHGARWQIRGREMEANGPALRRLLKRPDLRVLHAYGPAPREISGQEREALLERVKSFAAGEAPPYSAFWLAEFRNQDRQVMLVIEEPC